MSIQRMLLSSTTVSGICMVALYGVVAAADVKPGGALDIEINGFLQFEAGGDQLNDLTLDNSFARRLDFRNDTEVHVWARGRSGQSGLEYGAEFAFEADTDQTLNTDETWIFLRGGWGEVRMGDQEGVVENSIVGGQTVAAGTGGIDGSDFVIAGIASERVFPTRADKSTKIRYYTPSFAGFSVGVSYAPTQTNIDSGDNNGQFIARKNGDNAMDTQNIFEGGLVYEGNLGDVAVLASVVGQYGTVENSATASVGDGGFGGSDWYSFVDGASVGLHDFELAGSIGDDNVGNLQHNFLTAGLAYAFGELSTSITYVYIFNASNAFENFEGYNRPWNLVLSADHVLTPGLVLGGDVAYFNLDTNSNYDGGTGDTGWTG